MLKILHFAGNHPRHLFYANYIHNNYGLAGIVVQEREELLPEPPEGIDAHDRENFILHFNNRAAAEKKYFGEQPLPDCPSLIIKKSELNTEKIIDFIKIIQPDIALIFGCGLIKDNVRQYLPKEMINLHLGLSPRYRGSATLFWPFYFLEPNLAGSTFHYIIDEPDAGDIIHQCVPPLEPEDGIHDVGCKTIITSSKEAVKLLQRYEINRTWKNKIQTSTGKLFLNSDFRPEHLRINYDLYQDRMVRRFLNGQIKPKALSLFNQFE